MQRTRQPLRRREAAARVGQPPPTVPTDIKELAAKVQELELRIVDMESLVNKLKRERVL